MTKTLWRLIPLMEADGRLQMLIDQWLYTQHVQYNHPPTLRFYTWNPVAISLGYHQKKFPKSWENLTWRGKKIDLVYRPTGGRGVLHQGDLTYMVISSDFKGNNLETYHQICEFLITGWQKLGINLIYGQPQRSYFHNANCMAIATGADLVDSQGNKLIGSAQLKKSNTILQHGSMMVNPDLDLYYKIFGEKSHIDKLSFSFTEIITHLTQAAMECWQCEFFEQPLTKEELKLIVDTQKLTVNNHSNQQMS